MGVDIDAVNLSVDITDDGHITLDGHFIRLPMDGEETLYLRCNACGEEHSFDEVPKGPYKWEAILYLLGRFESHCVSDASDLHERIKEIMEPHVGKLATDTRVAAIENDVRDLVGDEVPININT